MALLHSSMLQVFDIREMGLMGIDDMMTSRFHINVIANPSLVSRYYLYIQVGEHCI